MCKDKRVDQYIVQDHEADVELLIRKRDPEELASIVVEAFREMLKPVTTARTIERSVNVKKTDQFFATDLLNRFIYNLDLNTEVPDHLTQFSGTEDTYFMTFIFSEVTEIGTIPKAASLGTYDLSTDYYKIIIDL